MQGTACTRRGSRCTGQAIDSRGTLIVIDDRPVYRPLCAACKAELLELLEPWVRDAPDAKWPRTPPVVAPDGTVWFTDERRAALELCGAGEALKPTGSLGPAQENMWRGLVVERPGLLDQVRAHMRADVAALIRERVEENRRS